jgi:hypothetical protein
MAGPSWVFRKVVKSIAKKAGADRSTAMVMGYLAGGLSSLIFHDHHTHFIPDLDEIGDGAELDSDFDIDSTEVASSGSDVRFGMEGRFDVPNAISSSGHAVGSDASGNLFDKQTGQSLSRY